MKNVEIADRIRVHLKRFESDPSINKKTSSDTSTYWNSSAATAGRYVCVQYVSYQGHSHLSKSDALKYLEWLDAGNIGKHWELSR